MRAVLSGAVTFAAIVDWLEGLPDSDLQRVGLSDRRPVATTIWRLLVRVDSVALAGVLAAGCWPVAASRDRATGGG